MSCPKGQYYNETKSKTLSSNKKFSETDIIKMLEFLIDNIFVMFSGHVFRLCSISPSLNEHKLFTN